MTALSIVMPEERKEGYIGSSFTNYKNKKLTEKSVNKSHKTERLFANVVSI